MHRRHFTQDDVHLLELAAERIALALDHARLLQDAEQRWRGEEAARHEAETHSRQVAAIVETMVDGVFVSDAQGHLLLSNAAAGRLLGLGEAAHRTLGPLEMTERATLFRPHDSQGTPLPQKAWPLSRILAGETLTSQRTSAVWITRPDGHERALSISGAPLRAADGSISGAVALARDVTEQRSREQRTQEARTTLLAIAEALVGPPSDDEQDATLGTEQAAAPSGARWPVEAQRLAILTCRVLGCTRVGITAIEPGTHTLRPVAVVGLPLDQERQRWAKPEEADPELLAHLAAGEALVVDMRQPPYNELPNPDNITTRLYAPIRVGSSVIGMLSLDYGGPPHEFADEERALASAVAKLAALLIDRARLLREQEEARASELALQQAHQRMDEFLHMVAHELRQPLTVLKASITLAGRRVGRLTTASREHAADPTPQVDQVANQIKPLRQLLDRSEHQANRLERLINDLVDASRVQTGKLELHLASCDLLAVVRESVEAQRQVQRDRTIHLRLPSEPPVVEVMADADRIQQVVTNYLTNAVKYSPADRAIEVTVLVNGNQVRIAVRDEGPGLPPKERRRIWERFHRARGVAGQNSTGIGLGLGLYICRQIVEQHGGHVGVESEVGRGSTFFFTIPFLP